MSQNIRAESGRPASTPGSTWNVAGSGRASMSLSLARAKPSMAEPSKPMPSSNAPSSSAGATATDFSVPRTSVNHSRTKRISRSSSVAQYEFLLPIHDAPVFRVAVTAKVTRTRHGPTGRRDAR